MTIDELIKRLQQLPQDAPVCIMDAEKNAYYAHGDGTSEGAYDIEIEHIKDVPEDSKPFVALCFNNGNESGLNAYKLIEIAEEIIDDDQIGFAAAIKKPVQTFDYSMPGKEEVMKYRLFVTIEAV